MRRQAEARDGRVPCPVKSEVGLRLLHVRLVRVGASTIPYFYTRTPRCRMSRLSHARCRGRRRISVSANACHWEGVDAPAIDRGNGAAIHARALDASLRYPGEGVDGLCGGEARGGTRRVQPGRELLVDAVVPEHVVGRRRRGRDGAPGRRRRRRACRRRARSAARGRGVGGGGDLKRGRVGARPDIAAVNAYVGEHRQDADRDARPHAQDEHEGAPTPECHRLVCTQGPGRRRAVQRPS